MGCSSELDFVPEEIEFNGTNYIQTFNDDFDAKELNSKKWEKCPEWERQSQMKNHGWWSNKCVHIEDSNLVLENMKEAGKLICGGIRSRGKFEQCNGLFKIRFKVEKALGLWYAFWLMDDNVSKVGNGAVNGGEIDILEILPFPKPFMNSALHWDGYGADHKSKASSIQLDDDFYNKWHEVAFEWTKDYYKAWLDDAEEPYWDTTGKADEWGGIVNVKNYMKITAEFGDWAGELDESVLPAKMYVDWVKVYKAK